MHVHIKNKTLGIIKGEDKHIVVVLEEGMKNSEEWREFSPLGAAIAGLPYIDLTSSDEAEIIQKHKEILDSINEKVSMLEFVV